LQGWKLGTSVMYELGKKLSGGTGVRKRDGAPNPGGRGGPKGCPFFWVKIIGTVSPAGPGGKHGRGNPSGGGRPPNTTRWPPKKN